MNRIRITAMTWCALALVLAALVIVPGTTRATDTIPSTCWEFPSAQGGTGHEFVKLERGVCYKGTPYIRHTAPIQGYCHTYHDDC